MTDPPQPAPWLIDNLDLIRPRGRVLDVASGRGRNALFLAERGYAVRAVDRNQSALDTLLERATSLSRGSIAVEAIDLETGGVSLGHRRYDAVIVFNYLHRPLIPAIVDAIAGDGVLIYETFTVGQAERGHPKNPAFLLQAGELPTLVAPLRVVRAREGDVDGRLVASIAARRE